MQLDDKTMRILADAVAKQTEKIRNEMLAARDETLIERAINDRLLTRLADMEIEMRMVGLVK